MAPAYPQPNRRLSPGRLPKLPHFGPGPKKLPGSPWRFGPPMLPGRPPPTPMPRFPTPTWIPTPQKHIPLPPGMPKFMPYLSPLLKRALWLNPMLFSMMTANELYRLLTMARPGGLDMTGWTQICYNGDTPLTRWKFSSSNPGLACATGGQVPDGTIGNQPVINAERNVRRWFAEGLYTPIGTVGRMRLSRQWSRPGDTSPNSPAREPIYYRPPVPARWTLPQPELPPWINPFPPIGVPLPFPDPPPFPLIPHIPRWNLPDGDVRGQPNGRTNPRVRPRYRDDPAIEIDFRPRERPDPKPPGHHPREPPGPGTKEKKGTIGGGLAGKWLQGLDKIINTYTESDDFIAAVYKALPWEIRRWRGRDGVWRDRDIGSQQRLERIYANLGKLSLSKAIKEVAENHGTDAAYGGIGKAMGGAIGKAAGTGYYSGLRGLQAGGAKQREITWEALYEELAKAAADRKAKTRTYTKWTKGKDGKWTVKEITVKDRTTIPWLRERSLKVRWAKPKRGTVDYWQRPSGDKGAYRRAYWQAWYRNG